MATKGKKSGELTSIPGEATATADKPKSSKPKSAKAEANRAAYDKLKSKESKAVAKQALDAEIINGMGRPTIYTPELANEVLARLTMGQSLRTVCRNDHLPAIQTVYNWMSSRPEFMERYTQAKKEAADMMAEDIMDISDDAQNDYMEVTYGDQSMLRLNSENIQRSRLRVETRKWLMAKLQPTKYGDKLDVTSNGRALPTPLLAGLVDAKDDIKQDES